MAEQSPDSEASLVPDFESHLGKTTIRFFGADQLAEDWRDLTQAEVAIHHSELPTDSAITIDAYAHTKEEGAESPRLHLSATISDDEYYIYERSEKGERIRVALKSSKNNPTNITVEKVTGVKISAEYGWAARIKVGNQRFHVGNIGHDSLKYRSKLFLQNFTPTVAAGAEVRYGLLPIENPIISSAEDSSERLIEFTQVLAFLRNYYVAESLSQPNKSNFRRRVFGSYVAKPAVKTLNEASFSVDGQERPDNLEFTYVQPKYVPEIKAQRLNKPKPVTPEDVTPPAQEVQPRQEPQQPRRPESQPTTITANAVTVIKPRFTLDDVGGNEKIKETIAEVALLFNNPTQAIEWEVDQPKGVLFYGEPGTGKTMLAHALASQTKSELWEVDSAKLFDMWLGLSGKNTSELFDSIVRYEGRLVVFFDEIDSILSITDNPGPGGAGAERNQVAGIFKRRLNTISQEKSNLLIVAATNNLDRLDPAIIRDGRFDYKIYVPMPDMWGRTQIITNRLVRLIENGVANQNDFSAPELAKTMDGMSGAAIENIFNRMRKRKAVKAIRTGQKQIVIQQDVLDEITDYRTNG